MAIKGRDLGGAAGTALGTYFGGPVGGSLGALAGGVLGGLFDSDEDYLTQAYNDAVNRYKELGIPPEEARPLILKDFKDQGVPDAILEEKMPKIISKLGQYKERAEPIQAQVSVLKQLSDYGKRGVTAEQEAANLQAQLKSDRATQARLASQQQALASRGLRGSGAEAAMMAQAVSAGASEEAEERSSANRLASQMALEALRGQREAAAEMRRQDLAAAETTLGAQDIMSRFGSEQQADLARRNIERLNLQTSRSAEQRQKYADLKTQGQNIELSRQRDAEQRDWARKRDYTAGLSNLELERAGKRASWQDRESERSAEMGRGLTQIAQQLPYDKIKAGVSGFFGGLGGGRSGGYDWSKGPSNPMEEIEADRAATESLRRYGYPGSKG